MTSSSASVITLNKTRQLFAEDSTLNHTDNPIKEANHHSVLELAPVIGYLILVTVVGTLGNSLVCYVYSRKMKKTTANSFILWLAILDLCTCLFGIPFDIYDIVYAYVFDQSVVCKIARFLTYSTVIASLTTLLSIAVDRYFKICKPHEPPPTRKPRYFIIGSAITGIILASPAAYFYETDPGVVGNACTVDRTTLYSLYAKLYLGVFFSVDVIVTLCVLILYICIGLKLRTVGRITNVDRPESVAREEDKNDRVRPKIHRATIVCVAITIAFVVSFLPTLTLNAIGASNEGFEEVLSGSSFVAFNLFVRSYFISNAINPVIYGFLNPRFRIQCVLMLKRLNPRGHSQTDTSTPVVTTS